MNSELKCCAVKEPKSRAFVTLTVHRRLRKKHVRGTVGRAVPRAQCAAAAQSRWMLRLCQLHVLWQHIKEEPGSLACEPCSVCPLPARNQTWHALLNKEFLRLWLQAASLKSISRQWKQWRTSVGEWEAVCVCVWGFAAGLLRVCVLEVGEECSGCTSGRTGLIRWCRQGGIQIGYDRNVKAGYH